MNTKRILFTGGGTGGHVYPLIAVAETFAKMSREQGIGLRLDYLGPYGGQRDELAAGGLRLHSLAAAKLRNYSLIANIFDVPVFFWSLIQAFWKTYWLMPDAVFSKGGPGALPVILAAWFYRIPILIHESDSAPGATNLASARFASRIALTFEEARKYFDPRKTAVTGTPIRPSLLASRTTPEAAKAALDFNADEPLVLVLGGSQGSVRLNNFILENLEAILADAQVLHQTGAANFGEVNRIGKDLTRAMPAEKIARHPYRAAPYLTDRLADAFAAADLVVSRAGSGTLSELAAFGKASLLIPFPEAAHDHQRANAYAFEAKGAAKVIEEENLLPKIFLHDFHALVADADLRAKMGQAARQFDRPDAAQTVAEELLRLAR